MRLFQKTKALFKVHSRGNKSFVKSAVFLFVNTEHVSYFDGRCVFRTASNIYEGTLSENS